MLRFTVLFACVVASLAIPPPPRPSNLVNVSHPGTGKIINGLDANEGQFPYIVSLNYVGGEHSCGGSILTSNWVLTASHCCLTGSDEYVYTSSIYLSHGGESFDIAETLVHPNYTGEMFWQNDICLVRINGQITFGPNAQQAVLANTGFEVPDHGRVVVAGWGYNNASQIIPDRLKVVTQYFARSDCQGDSGVPAFDGQMCAIGKNEQGVCKGDSGGPLTYNGVQVGITSFNFLPCAGTGVPDYFTRVSYYIPWILENLADAASSVKLAG